MPVIRPARRDLMEVVGALCVNIKMNISSMKDLSSMQEET